MINYMAELAREVATRTLPDVIVDNASVIEVPRKYNKIAVPISPVIEMSVEPEFDLAANVNKDIDRVIVELLPYQDKYGRQINYGYCQETNTIYYN